MCSSGFSKGYNVHFRIIFLNWKRCRTENMNYLFRCLKTIWTYFILTRFFETVWTVDVFQEYLVNQSYRNRRNCFQTP